MIDFTHIDSQGCDEADLERVQQFLTEKYRIRNITRDPEMGNLSPEQVAKLLYTEWNTPDAAIRLTSDLPLTKLKKSDLFRWARWLLLAIHEAKGVKATPGKNLPRKLVTQMVNKALDSTLREDLWQFNKVLNEVDVNPVHITRVACQAAGVLRLYKGRFVIPKTKAHFFKPEQPGELFTLLFTAYFRKLNMAYASNFGPDANALQSSFPYTLYRLGELAADWCPTEQLTDEVLLPAIRHEILLELGEPSTWSLGELLEYRVIMPLIEWGLLDARYDSDIKYFKKLTDIRTTDLYRDFITFTLPDARDWRP